MGRRIVRLEMNKVLQQDGRITLDCSSSLRAGLIGEGILASRSPWLHEQEARAQGLSLDYTLFDFADRGWQLADMAPLLGDLQAAGYCGTNVTFPFKQAIIPLLDDLSQDAGAVGAVNTVAFRDGRMIGHNTDMFGFAESMRRGLSGSRVARVLQLGCGGAGAAVAHALLGYLDVGTLLLHDVEAARAQQLHDQLVARYGAGRVALTASPQADLASCDGLVNATPVGMARFPGLPLDLVALRPDHWVADIVYFPLETALLKAARQLGCATLDGSRMVVHQAAEAFRIMTGHTADPDRMMRSFAAFDPAKTAASD
jgi:shikimate dehydrogenase